MHVMLTLITSKLTHSTSVQSANLVHAVVMATDIQAVDCSNKPRGKTNKHHLQVSDGLHSSSCCWFYSRNHTRKKANPQLFQVWHFWRKKILPALVVLLTIWADCFESNTYISVPLCIGPTYLWNPPTKTLRKLFNSIAFICS